MSASAREAGGTVVLATNGAIDSDDRTEATPWLEGTRHRAGADDHLEPERQVVGLQQLGPGLVGD
ncbi:MAG TPA: hypothetical protein VFC13_12030, partial [Actinomycetes bacterium]|nr:hypothetical protein [Actinomycetes bacterium]